MKYLYSVLDTVRHGSRQFASLIKPTKHNLEVTGTLQCSVFAVDLYRNISIARECS